MALLSISCQQADKHDRASGPFHHSINLLSDENDVSHHFDDLFYWKETIPLTFQDETVLGEISKVIRTNDHFYVLDSKTQTLYQFDHSGLNTNRYGNVGQGPGEYIRIDDFLVDTLHQQIITIGNEGKAGIYIYDLRTSDFIEKFSANIFPLNFCKYGDDLLVYTSKNPSEIGEFDVFRINNDGQILDQFMSYKADVPIVSTNSGFLRKSAKGVFYSPQYHEQIYVFDDTLQSFIPYMHVSINNAFIEEHKDKPMEIFKSKAIMQDGTSFLMSTFESNDSYTILTFHRKKRLGVAIHKNVSRETVQILPESLPHDIRFRLLDIFHPHTLSDDNEIVFSIDPADLLKEKGRLTEYVDFPSEITRLLKDTQIDGGGRHYLVITKIKF